MQGFIDGAGITVKSSSFKSYDAMVTPEVAQLWLDTQVWNRRVQFAAMLGYRSNMRTGLWRFAGDPIRFDKKGHLIDGQNRLTALAGIEDPEFSLPFVVQVGHETEAQKVMDQGARRTTGQQLGLAGITSGTYVAAGYKLKVLWENGELFVHDRAQTPVTTSDVLAWIADNEQVVNDSISHLNMLRKVGLRPSAGLAVTMRIVEGGYNDEIGALLREVHDLTDLPAGSPALTLARRLRNARNSETARNLDLIDHIGFLTQTWNSWVNNRERHGLQRPTGGWNIDNMPKLDI